MKHVGISMGVPPPLPDHQLDGAFLAREAERLGFDSIWCGDHVAFAIPILDPIVQLAQAATYSDRLAIGTCVYLLSCAIPARSATLVMSRPPIRSPGVFAAASFFRPEGPKNTLYYTGNLVGPPQAPAKFWGI